MSTKNLLDFPNRAPVECGNCGGHAVSTRQEAQQFEYGADAVLLEATVPIHTCGDCGFEFTDHAAEVARHDAVCRHLGVLSPRQVEAVRRSFGLSRAEFARLSRIGEASLARWENGLLIQNASSDRLLYLLTFPDNLERLRQREAQPDAAQQVGWAPRFRALTDLAAMRIEAASFQLRIAPA